MSFIAGYILGGCGRVREIDPRVKKLDETPTLRKFDIADGWDVRVKIASDVDNMQFFKFGEIHGGIVDYITMWSIYYCVYLNNKFKYATCFTNFWTKRHENYQNLDVPQRLYGIYEYSGFLITSGEMTVNKGGSNFLRIDVEGTYIKSETPYSWTNDSDRIKGETSTTMGTFTHSKNDFGGSQYNGNYIINGDGDDFLQSVYGLYAVCRSCAG
ncbi:hypothetical protein [Huintestinicola sp.]|uniref:hypothetical protein n=1 Tax=Huintestinicola sp. TaxID=2981661 RepID=UPI003D7C8F14